MAGEEGKKPGSWPDAGPMVVSPSHGFPSADIV